MLHVLDLDDAPRTPAGRIDVDRLVDGVAALRGTPWWLDSQPGMPGPTGWSAIVVGTAGRLVVPAVCDDGTPDPFAELEGL